MPNSFQTPQAEAETLQVYCQDGYALTARHYPPVQQANTLHLVVASATGVPQLFYRRFAEYAAARGFHVWTFDYRGVAESAPKDLKQFEMSYLDWGRLDLAAMLQYIAVHFPKQQQFLIGHSYGGQAIGLLPNHHLLRAAFCFGTGAGWHGYMPWKARFQVGVMWNLVFPPLVKWYGYLPWQKFNMGADLPKAVYRDWRRWCQNPLYYFADSDLSELHHQFAEVRLPIYAYAALDDDWALPSSRQAFMQHYRQAKLHFIDLNPKSFGLKQIGHMGYFRQGAEKLWQQVLDKTVQLSTTSA